MHLNFKDKDPYLLFKKQQLENNIKFKHETHKMDNSFQKANFNSNNSVYSVDRKVSLYSKLQDSLQKYMSNHSKDLTFQGNKRFLGKSGDYYLQSKKGDYIVKLKVI